MAVNGNELRVPVNLTINNLQQIINELQSKLGNLKVGSKGFKEIQSIIGSLTREMDRLQIQTSKPFMNQGQFNAAERSVNKLEDELERVQIAIGRIKFDDLQLNPGQLSQLQAFNQEIQNIKNSIKNIKETAKQEFLGSEAGLAWMGFSEKNAATATMSLQQLTNAISSAYAQQGKAVDEAKAKVEAYSKAMSLQDNITSFQEKINKASTVKDTSKIFGDIYSQIFTAPGNAFKSGGRTILENWLEQQFQLDETKVRELVSQSANKVLDSLKNGELSELLNKKLNESRKGTAGTTNNEVNAEYEAKRAKLAELEPVLQAIISLNNGLGASEDELRAKLKAVEQALGEFKERQAEAARGNQDIQNTCKKGNAELANFKTQLSKTNAEFLKMERAQRQFNSMKMTVTNFMGFAQVLNLTKRAIRDALNHIKELDSVMNKISIVTSMTTGDLWQQVDSYSDMAQKYGVSIKGAYEVSQIYYQQGLDTKDVLTLTNETLKLAKVSGLDYAATTDYMTTALRGFKMEMSEASTVVDVYSNLAAHTAVTQEELAVAMSKTASSLQSVGASFEESSAMIATMVTVTRESATNIGSALKSIAARYGEMKKDPLAMVDAEGDALSYNKVDAALQSVGITLKTTDGQFRNFTDVIIELSEKWDQLESTQQRYIATQFAGNRQQSRFLALVSNPELLRSNLKYAENSEDTGTLQALKALDSIESKTEQVRVAYQQMYTTIGAEDIWKGFLDGAKNVMNTLNSLPKLFGKIPVGAIAMVYDFVQVIKTLGLNLLSGVAKIWDHLLPPNLPEQAATLAGQMGDTFADQLLKKIEERNPGGEMSNKVADQAQKAGQDENQPAGEKKIPEKAARPAENKIEENIAKTQAVTEAQNAVAQSANQAADAQERGAEAAQKAAEAAKEQAAAVQNAADSTSSTYNIQSSIDLSAQIEKIGLAEAINTQLSGHIIDTDTPVQQIENMFVQILHTVNDAGGELRAAFSAASDDAISGYVHTLLQAQGVAEAGQIVGQISIQALRNAIGAHSDADETISAADDYSGGYVHTIVARIGDAANAGSLYAKASVDAMRKELEEGLQQELDALEQSRIKAESQIKGRLGESGLTSTQEAEFEARRQAIAQRKQEDKVAYQGMVLTQEERDRKEQLESEIFAFTESKKRLTLEQVTAKEAKEEELERLQKKELEANTFKSSAASRARNATRKLNQDIVEAKSINEQETKRLIQENNAKYAQQVQIAKGQAENGFSILQQASQKSAMALVNSETGSSKIESIEAETAATKEHTEAVQADNQAKQEQSNSQQQAFTQTDNIKQDTAAIEEHTAAIQADKEAQQESATNIDFSQYKTVPSEVRDREAFVGTVATGEGITPISTPSWEERAASVTAPNINKTEEKGAQAAEEIVRTMEQKTTSSEISSPSINTQEAGKQASEQLTEEIQTTFKPPELSNTPFNIFDANGIQQTVESITAILTQMGNVADEQKQKLLDLFNSGNHAEFINQYNALTGTGGQSNTGSIDILSQMAPTVAAPISEVDTSTTVDQLQEVNNKLIETGNTAEEVGEQMKEGLESASPEELGDQLSGLRSKLELVKDAATGAAAKLSSMNFSTLGSAIRMLASISGLSQQAKGAITLLGGAITGLGVIIKMVDAASKSAAASNPWMGIAMAVMAVINGISMLWETQDEKIERLNKEAEELTNKSKQLKSDSRELETTKKKIDELEKKRYDGAEAAEEYQEAVDDLTSKFPGLIQGFDEAGNAILNVSALEDELTAAREKAAQAAYDAAQAERKAYEEQAKRAQSKVTNESSFEGPSAGQRSQDETIEAQKNLRALQSGSWLVESYEAQRNYNSSWNTDILASMNGAGAGPEKYLSYLKEQMASALGSESYKTYLYSRNHEDDGSLAMYQSLAQLNLGGNNDIAKLEEIYQLINLVQDAEGIDQLRIEDIPESLRAILGIGDFNTDELFKDWAKFNNIDTTWLEESSQVGQELFEVLDLIFNGEKKLQGVEEVSNQTEIISKTLRENKLLKNNDLGKYADDIQLVNAAVQAYQDAVNNGEWDTAESAYQDLRIIQSAVNSSTDENLNYLKDYFKGIDKSLNTIGPLLSEANTNVKSASASGKAQISSRLTQLYQGYQTFFDDKSGLTSVISNKMYKDFEIAKQKAQDVGKSLDFDDWLSSNADQLAMQYATIIEPFWYNDLNKNEKALFTKMLQSTDKYSYEDIISTFEIDPDSQLATLLFENYQDIATRIRERLTNKIRSSEYSTYGQQVPQEERTGLNNVVSNFDVTSWGADTVQEEKYLNKAFDQMILFADSGYSDIASAYGNKTLEFYSLLNTLSAEQKASVLEQVNNNSLNTKEGISKIIESIKIDESLDNETKKALIDKLNETKGLLITNIGLELQTAVDSYLEGWKNNSKTLSKLTSGIDITDVDSILQSDAGKKAEITFDSFIMNGDKLILSEDAADKYIEKYFEVENEKLLGYQKALTKAIGSWGTLDENGKLNADIKEKTLDATGAQEIESIIGVGNLKKYATYNNETGKWVVDNHKDLNDALEKAYAEAQENYTAYGDYLRWSQEQITKTNQWNRGNYTSLKSIFDISDDSAFRTKIENIISGEKGEKLSNYAATPDVKNAINKIKDNVSKFLSDAISKGIDNIDLSDYEGLPNWIAEEWKSSNHSESLYQFARKYVSYLGSGIEESNNLIMEALEKEREKTSADAIKDLTFLNDSQFSATASELKEFANTFGLNLVELIDSGIVGYNAALGEYVVDYTQIDGLDLSQVEGFKDTVQDSINNFFKQLTDLIKKGLTGSLSNADVTTLKNNLQAAGVNLETINNLDFNKTADGLKLSQQSAIELYDTLKDIDSLQASLVFDELSKSLKENSEYYKTIGRNEERIVALENKVLTSEQQSILSSLNGNVDLFNRPVLQNADGTISTLLTATEESRNYQSDLSWVMNISPITPDGQKLDEDNFYGYIQDLVDATGGDMQQMIELDKLQFGLIIEGENTTESQHDQILSNYDARAEKLHEIGEIIEENKANETYNDKKIKQYEKELELAKEIKAERSTTEDASFDFMSNSIPGAQNNPLKYFESWGKAWKTLKDSFDVKGADKGKIGYQDFYNIITEMGNIAAKSGTPIQLGAEKFVANAQDAAALIEEGAQCLTVATDGSIKVDLSKFGLDFETGADAMKSGVNEGIREMAKSQVEMLDGMIQLMETIVAMEKLGDIDVDGNGIDFSEMFTAFSWDQTNHEIATYAWKEGMQTAAQNILDYADKLGPDSDLYKGLSNVQANGVSLRTMFEQASKNIEVSKKDAEAYHAVMAAFYKAVQSGDYSNENIMKSIKEVLGSTGYEGEIQVGDLKLKFHQGVALERDKDGKYILPDGQKTTDADVAAQAMKADSLDALKAAAEKTETDAETGEVTYTFAEGVTVEVTVDAENHYKAHIPNVGTITANSKEELQAGITAVAKLENIALNAENKVTFTYTTEAGIQTIVTVDMTDAENPKVNTEGNGDGVDLDELTKAALEAVQEQATSAAASASGQTVNAEVNDVKIQLSADAKPEIDLSGKEISVIGLPDTIEIPAPGPVIKYAKDSITVDITGLKGTGTGTLSINDCTLEFNEQGKAVVKNGNTILTEVPVNDLIGKGTGTLSAGQCELSFSEDGTTASIKQGETEIKIPIDGLQGSGIGSFTAGDCTLTFNSDDSTATLAQGQESVVIPIKDLVGAGTGTLTAGQCKFEYNALTGEASINLPNGIIIPIDSDKLNGVGTLTAEKCEVSLDSTQLTLSHTNENNETSIITVALDNLQGIGELNKEACTVTLSPSGKLEVVTENGKKYEVNIPQDAVEGTATLLEAKVKWSEKGENLVPDIELPDSIDLGTIDGEIKVVKKYIPVEDDDQQFKNQFGNELANARHNWNNSNTSGITGIEQQEIWPTRGGVVIDENNLKRTQRYVSLLQEDVSKNGVLSKTSRDNLKELFDTIRDTNDDSLITLKSTIGEILAADTTNLESLTETASLLSTMPVDNIQSLATSLDLAYQSLTNLASFDYEGLAARMALLIMPDEQANSQTSEETKISEIGSTTVVVTYEADTTPATEAAEAAKESIESEPAIEQIEGEDHATEVGKKAQSNINAMSAAIRISATNSASSVINSIKRALDNLVNGGPYNVTVKADVTTSGVPGATGNFGLAHAAGTLMGELGPELVVSNGRYFVVGQNGPEMVNLSKDAIVFNHLQTKSLLEKGMSSTRGKAVTNERVASAYATGNVNGGPAKASASSALATLKQLKAQWQALANLDVASLAGTGGGGGGGGGKDDAARKAWLTQVERWYNLMQQIAQLEKDITHEETLRSKINSDFKKNGKAYYESQLKALRALQEQQVAQKELNISRQEFFEQRREQLNTANGPFNQLYSFDENGQLKYNNENAFRIKDGSTVTGGFAFMSELMKVDEMGTPKYSAEDQYNMLVNAGFKDFMQYDTSGAQIEKPEEGDLTSFYSSSVQALFEHMDSQREEMQNLHDTIEEGENSMLELQEAQNEILEEIRNNQIAVEEAVLEAIEDSRQRAIDNLSDERGALEDSTSKFIEGLSDALSKEKDLYTKNEDSEELNKMRRQLAILQRSGGSGAEIRSLQENIRSKSKDAYFEEQQRQIDAIQTASDLQLERLDAQIDLMTKTLEYEKEHGMLWGEVYQVMAKTPEDITTFIYEENSKYWGNSPLKSEEEMNNILFMSDQWAAFRDSQDEQLTNIWDKTADELTIRDAVYGEDNSWNVFTTAMSNLYGEQWRGMAQDYKDAFETKMAQTADITQATQLIENSLGSLGDKMVSALSKPDPVAISSGTGSGSSSSNSGNKKSSSGGNNTWKNVGKPSGWKHDASSHWQEQLQKNGKGEERTEIVNKANHDKKKRVDTGGTEVCYCSVCGYYMGIEYKVNNYNRRLKSGSNTAAAYGNAFANGSLLGELGPELVVTNGKTHLVGTNGAEMVNLPDDAIIFNHLQTKELLNSGRTSRGIPAISDKISAGYNSIMSKWFWEGANNIQNSMLSFANGNIPSNEAISNMSNINDSVIIENVSVNMNVSKIANDYDAQRAGEQAMAKMLEIARKTNVKNSIRR